MKIWEIPEGGLKKSLTEPLQDLVAHQRRVGFITWHPTAYGILLSSGADNRLILWNVSSGAPFHSVHTVRLPAVDRRFVLFTSFIYLFVILSN